MPFDDTGEGGNNGRRRPSRNVLGGALASCSQAPITTTPVTDTPVSAPPGAGTPATSTPSPVPPLTGFFRTGACDTSPEDLGSHTVCAVMTEAFLAFSRHAGNDLSTPYPAYGFPGLRPGDHWCLCAPRWQEALEAGQAPRVLLAATHEGALRYCSLDDLRRHAADPP